MEDTIHLDSSGDLRLLVKDSGDEQRTLIVSSSAMCLASPVWRAMLNPKSHFKEAEKREVEFPDDDLDALLIILRVAHLKFRDLPESVSFDGLVNLAVICDKYDTIGVVRKWLPGWLAPWYEESCSPGYEEWLSIAWTIGDFATFEKVTRHLIESCNIDKAGRLCHLGKPFTVSVVPDVIDRISESRKYLVSELLNSRSKLVHRYRSERRPVRTRAGVFIQNSVRMELGHECDTTVSVSGSTGRKRIRILSSYIAPTDIRKSALTLMREIQLIRCYSPREPQDTSSIVSDYSSCALTKKLTEKLKQDIDHINKNIVPLAIKMAIDDSFRKHMKEQAEK